MIPYGRQSIDEADIADVVAVLKSLLLTQGPTIERFERAVAEACGVEYAVAVSSATAGLHIACIALGVGPGDLVWTSPNTFVASANCARYCGADVDFVDIDPHTLNMDAGALQEKLEMTARRGGRLPKLVIPVHFAGQSCPMADFQTLAQRYGFRLLEDAAHAIGGTYQSAPVGSCPYSDAAVFSFHPVKIVTTGEGGVIVTRDRGLYRKLLLLRSHGITRDTDLMTIPSPGIWYYEQVDLGFNYRMTDIHAALGASQMRKLESFVTRRRELVARYQVALLHSGLGLPVVHPDADPSWHLYVVQLPEAKHRRRIFDAMRTAGIGVNVHYMPVHTQPSYQSLGFHTGQYPRAEDYYSRAITIPLHPVLTFEEQDYVVETLIRSL